MSTNSAAEKGSGKKAIKRFHVDSVPFLPRLIAGSIKFLHRTCRFTVVGEEHMEEALKHGSPVLFTAWHFSFPAVIYHFRDRNGMVMVSRSRDGEWIARILGHLGYLSARGSHDKGGGMALRRLIGHTRKGYSTGLIADGSQGPARVAQSGILLLAARTCAPLVPVSMAASPQWRLRTWDQTVIAKPFSRVVMAYGPPIQVGKDSTHDQLEAIRLQLENSLNELTRRCEQGIRKTGTQV